MRRTTRSGRNADIEMRWENIACRRKEWRFRLAMRREVSASDERSSLGVHCLRRRVFVSFKVFAPPSDHVTEHDVAVHRYQSSKRSKFAGRTKQGLKKQGQS